MERRLEHARSEDGEDLKAFGERSLGGAVHYQVKGA